MRHGGVLYLGGCPAAEARTRKLSAHAIPITALRSKEAAHKRNLARLQDACASRAEEEAERTAECAKLETQEPRRSWALRAASVAAMDAAEQRQWAVKLDAEATALEAAQQQQQAE